MLGKSVLPGLRKTEWSSFYVSTAKHIVGNGVGWNCERISCRKFFLGFAF